MCACTHVAPLENVLVAASLLRTFLKAPCHLELFQENNLSRGRPRVGVLRTYQAPRHASLPKHFCLCRSASVYVTWWSCLGESQQFFALASQVFFFPANISFPNLVFITSWLKRLLLTLQFGCRLETSALLQPLICLVGRSFRLSHPWNCFNFWPLPPAAVNKIFYVCMLWWQVRQSAQ